MHGRLKVRTTAEERERKRKEQLLKMKAYRAAMTRLQAKRQAKELDDEMLKLTSQILQRNPDVSTLWNMRRECILQKVEQLTEAAKDKAACKQAALEEEPKEASVDVQTKEITEGVEELTIDTKAEGIAKQEVDDVPLAAQLQAVYDVELTLTAQCLMANPKSYSAWHHRCWTLEHSPHAAWDREMQLCNRYLKLDARNFHTWDYRRYVATKAGIEQQQEVDYCTEHIKENFSNYSAWHYRSQLLPALYPYECANQLEAKRPMSEAKLQEELELVLTAAFTDPNDSSAWFYQRWLLGSSSPELDICAFRCDQAKAVLCFTNETALQDIKVLLTTTAGGDNKLKLNHWRSLNGTDVDAVWLAAVPAEHTLHFEGAEGYQLQTDIHTLKSEQLPLKYYNNSYYYFNAPNRGLSSSAELIKELTSQLESCNSLLEYEPDSKWTLLTAALLMRAVDQQRYHTQSLEHLAKLQQVDALREGYYKDLASKWILEKLLTDWALSEDMPKQLDLSNEAQLTGIYYRQYFSIADELVLAPALQQVPREAALPTFSSITGTPSS